MDPTPENTAEHRTAEELTKPSEVAPPGVLADFCDFLIHNKKWWLTPIVLVIILVAALVFFSPPPAAPFIYPF